LSNVQAPPAGVSLSRVLDLSGLPVVGGYVYTVTAGNATGSFTAVAANATTGVVASTVQDVLAGLVESLNLTSSGTNITATPLSATVAATWAGVLGALDTLLTADGQVSATVSGSSLTLTGSTNNVPFVVNAVYASPSTGLAGDPGLPLVPAAQVSKIIFTDDAVVGDDFEMRSGYTFAVSMGPRNYSVTTGQDSVTADWTSILTKLASKIQTGENNAVDAGIAAATVLQPYSGTKLTVSVDAPTRSITLTAVTQDIGFNVGGVAVTFSGNRAV
ncbi:hypothetical protein JZU57_02710, partial [bacterium]|nr:hypothetical protein [bacterium]